MDPTTANASIWTCSKRGLVGTAKIREHAAAYSRTTSTLISDEQPICSDRRRADGLMVFLTIVKPRSFFFATAGRFAEGADYPHHCLIRVGFVRLPGFIL